jgi:integrase
MSPRKASLRVAHQATCPHANQTSIDSLRGCKCKPAYYTFHRDRSGRPVKGPRVRDRQVAERSLRKVQVEIDEGRAGIERPDERPFSEWAAEFLEIIAKNGRKASTVAAYRPTIRYCEPVFGSSPLREIGNPELRSLVDKVRENKGGDATVSKHLRHVGAIFQAAVDDRLIKENPVPRFKKSLRLQIVGGVEPFTDAELAKLWARMEAANVESVYVTACKLCVTTGARAGEIAALNLDDVDLLAGTLKISRHYDRASGQLTLPKDGEARTVHLIAPARALLEAWVAEHGDVPGDAPLFPAPRSGGRLNTQYLGRVVLAAMEKAGIPEVGEGGRKRKPLHSLRATFTRLMLEQGRNPEWVRRELGHSSLELTGNVYGEWSEAAKAAEAAKVEPLAFPV